MNDDTDPEWWGPKANSASNLTALLYGEGDLVAHGRPNTHTHKLGISDLPGLVRFAIQHGLTPLE